MYHAEISDFETVKEIFYLHKKWFPHIRTDYMKRMIAKKNLILENDVVITYNFYKRKQKIGDIQAFKDDCILHQIAAKGKGTASDVLQKFFKFFRSGNCVTVDSHYFMIWKQFICLFFYPFSPNS